MPRPRRSDDPTRPPSDAIAERHLKDVIENVRSIGILFVLIGLGTLFFVVMARTPGYVIGAAIVSCFVVTPGLLYVIAGLFLARRRYWAWVVTRVMTFALLAVVAGIWIFTLFTRISTVGMTVTLVCWSGALSAILHSLNQCAAHVRLDDSLAQKGFGVIPIARVAPTSPPVPSTTRHEQ